MTRMTVLAVLLAASGCATAPDVAPPAFGGGLPVAPVQVAVAGPHDGLYAGAARVSVNMNLACEPRIALGGLRVDGGQLRFGGFRGTVQADGSVVARFGRSNIFGRFAAGGFEGRITHYPSLLNDSQSCIYEAELRRVGA